MDLLAMACLSRILPARSRGWQVDSDKPQLLALYHEILRQLEMHHCLSGDIKVAVARKAGTRGTSTAAGKSPNQQACAAGSDPSDQHAETCAAADHRGRAEVASRWSAPGIRAPAGDVCAAM